MADRMVARPNTTVDVFRDADATDTDIYGDDVETGTDPLYAAEPALIVSEQVVAPQDGNPRVIRRPIARMRPDLDVREGDRLRDMDGNFYSVDTVTRPRFSVDRLLDVRLELTRVS